VSSRIGEPRMDIIFYRENSAMRFRLEQLEPWLRVLIGRSLAVEIPFLAAAQPHRHPGMARGCCEKVGSDPDGSSRHLGWPAIGSLKALLYCPHVPAVGHLTLAICDPNQTCALSASHGLPVDLEVSAVRSIFCCFWSSAMKCDICILPIARWPSNSWNTCGLARR